MKVLVACERFGVVRDAFRKAGHDAWSCDLVPDEGGGTYHHTGNALDIIGKGWDLLIAHPPCTYLTTTGAKWFYHPEDSHLPMDERRPHPKFPDRRRQQDDAAAFFMALMNAPVERIAVENPVGVMSTRFRKPDQCIQPYEFGHPEPKRTCLWLKNLPKLQATNVVEPDYHITKSGKRVPRWMFFADKSKGQEHRAMIRSKTFQGIADAMVNQWT